MLDDYFGSIKITSLEQKEIRDFSYSSVMHRRQTYTQSAIDGEKTTYPLHNGSPMMKQDMPFRTHLAILRMTLPGMTCHFRISSHCLRYVSSLHFNLFCRQYSNESV